MMPRIRKGASKETDKMIGAKIRYYRTQKGFTQGALAAALDVSFQQIQKFEKGMNGISAHQLILLAECLEVKIVDLLPSSAKWTDVARDTRPAPLVIDASAIAVIMKALPRAELRAAFETLLERFAASIEAAQKRKPS